MRDGDPTFTPQMIDLTESILREYIANLRIGDVFEAVHKVVQQLNELGGFEGTLGNFIETMERDELCTLINQLAREAGATADHDLTEEWREW